DRPRLDDADDRIAHPPQESAVGEPGIVVISLAQRHPPDAVGDLRAGASIGVRSGHALKPILRMLSSPTGSGARSRRLGRAARHAPPPAMAAWRPPKPRRSWPEAERGDDTPAGRILKPLAASAAASLPGRPNRLAGQAGIVR